MGVKAQEAEELLPRVLKGGRGFPFYNKSAPVLSIFLVFFLLLIYFGSAQPSPFPHACRTSIHGSLDSCPRALGARGTCSQKLTVAVGRESSRSSL